MQASRLPGMDETALVKELQEKGVSFAGRIEKTSWLEEQYARAREVLTRRRAGSVGEG
jgi:hypothetical protein